MSTLDDVIAASVERALLAALPRLLQKINSQDHNSDEMSASAAARRKHRRTSDVLAALHDGTLRGRFRPGGHGGRGRWSIASRDLDAWAEKS